MSPSLPKPETPEPLNGVSFKGGWDHVQYFQFGSPEVPFTLECGRSLPSVSVAFETYGKPNQDASNAILVVHALTGDSHVASHPIGEGDESTEEQGIAQRPGWWEGLVGPGKALDTNRYWVICSNVLGGCKGTTGPSSINPETSKPYGIDFPIVTIGDMVEVQRHLADFLGIKRWVSVVGGSLGGFQALEWALRYPDRVGSVVALATASKLSAQGIAFNAVGRHAITQDPEWKRGQYYGEPSGATQNDPVNGPVNGLTTARQMAHITYLSETILEEKFGRRLQSAERLAFDFSKEFAIESYLAHQGDKFIQRFDANSYLYLTKTMDYFDLESQYGPLHQAFERVESRVLVVSYTSDWLFPTAQSKAIVRALQANQKDVSFVELASDHGHDAFLIELESLTDILVPFLSQTVVDMEASRVVPTERVPA